MDVKLHTNRQKHKDNLKSEQQHKDILTFFTNSESNSDRLSVIRTECLFTGFLLEHNLPFAAADHAGLLFRKMFPKCVEAKNYRCARTKTSAIIGQMARKENSEMWKI